MSMNKCQQNALQADKLIRKKQFLDCQLSEAFFLGHTSNSNETPTFSYKLIIPHFPNPSSLFLFLFLFCPIFFIEKRKKGRGRWLCYFRFLSDETRPPTVTCSLFYPKNNLNPLPLVRPVPPATVTFITATTTSSRLSTWTIAPIHSPRTRSWDLCTRLLKNIANSTIW